MKLFLLNIIYIIMLLSWMSSCAVLYIVASEIIAKGVINSEGEATVNDKTESDDAIGEVRAGEGGGIKDSTETPEQHMFNFVEALSYNSVISNGLTDTGQPLVISLVDTATAGLQEALPSITTLLNSSGQKETLNKTAEQNVLDGDKLALSNASIDNNNETEEGETPKSSGEPPPLIVVAEPKTDIKIEHSDKNSEINISGDARETGNGNTSLVDNLSKPQSESLKPTESPEEIPSFSEWAQKQLEEAEKKDTVMNQSTQSPHLISASSSKLKLRSKNYASPDCGAKIVAANPEAGSSRSILSPSKDEYMLNTCNSRIWFVVELCEPVQAKKVEMANFELFSSSPKDFTIFSSDRFPTREWSSVGQFTAKDERDIQTFNLHPHIFSKFIKVEMLTHYGSEHYCPISMFKVYGTSEFEVLETENLIHSHDVHILEDDEDDLKEELKPTDSSKNLFGSARDAVMSIMKKAAEVLVKSNEPKNSSETYDNPVRVVKHCLTPSHIIVCDNCSDSLYGDVFNLLSCSNDRIQKIIDNVMIYEAFQNSDVCEEYGLDFKNKRISSYRNDTAVYVSALFMPSYVAALCNMLAIKEKKVVLNTSFEVELNSTTNLTIDRAVTSANINVNMDKIIQDHFVTDTVNDMQKLCENDLSDSYLHEDVGTSDLNINPTKTTKAEFETSEFVQTIDSNKNDNVEGVSRLENAQSSATTISLEGNLNINTENLSDNDTLMNLKESQSKGEDQGGNITHNKRNQSVNASQNETTANNTNGTNWPSDEIIINENISLDSFLSDLDQVASEVGNIGLQTTTLSPNSALPQGQKESVFLRLSNRIKSLERNMSLSSQYLEELSRRYKKQVEEMQKTFEKTVTAMNEENQRAAERDNQMADHISSLQNEVALLKDAVNTLLRDRDSWFGNVSFFKFVVLQLITFIIFAYLFVRQPSENVPSADRRSAKIKRAQLSKVAVRRKSVEGVSGHQTPSSKKRRPSEEAFHIAMHSYDSEVDDGDWIRVKYDKKKRKRKASVMSRPSYLSTTSENPFDDERNAKRQDGKDLMIENVLALDEPEFIIPGTDPVDFENIGKAVEVIKSNGTASVNDFTKVNGSAVDQKSAVKQGKTRRLSSPAFLKSALSRQSSRNSASPLATIKSQTVVLENNVAVKGSTPASVQSSIGDVSQDSNTAVATDGSSKVKRGKSKSFKSIFKKVF